MLSQVTCPACGAGWADADVSCPACGFVHPPLPAAEELIASWVVASTPAESPPTARDTVCVACGYEGPMVPSPDGDRGRCPACGEPWQDRGGIIRRSTCPECGQLLLLTERDRGRTVICPGCRSLLGCLLEREGRKRARRPMLLYLVTVSAALALGYNVASDLWVRQVPGRPLRPFSVVVLPITWSLVALRVIGPRPPRRRRFDPPGLAACLAVSAASLLNAVGAGDIALTRRTVTYDVFTLAALRIVEPLPLAAAVAGIWSVLIFNRRWRPEPTWMDRVGRCLGMYWLAAGLVVPLLRLFF
jgi:hypothetical protein